MSTKAGNHRDRTSKHGRAPGKGRVRIGEASGLRKLMRAARRGRVPVERIRIIVDAMTYALRPERAWLYANSKQRFKPTGPFTFADAPTLAPVTLDLSVHGSKPNPDPAALVGLVS